MISLLCLALVRLQNGVTDGFLLFMLIIAVALFIGSKKGSGKKEEKHEDRHCPKCGRGIPIDARMCPYCSKKFW